MCFPLESFYKGTCVGTAYVKIYRCVYICSNMFVFLQGIFFIKKKHRRCISRRRLSIKLGTI